MLNLSVDLVGASTEFYGSGFSGSQDHIGTGAGQFSSGASGYLGFRFVPDENPQNIAYMYGWMRVSLDNTGGGTIHEWAYEDGGADLGGCCAGAGYCCHCWLDCWLLRGSFCLERGRARCPNALTWSTRWVELIGGSGGSIGISNPTFG